MRKRILIATLAAAALLVAPVAGTDAKPDGVGGPTGPKKCDKQKSVGFKVRGTFDGYVAPNLTIAVDHFNRHAGDWLAVPNEPIFDTSDARKIKFIGVTDILTDTNETVGFEDAVDTDRVKLKAKLLEPKKGCDGEVTLEVKKITVKRPGGTETDQID